MQAKYTKITAIIVGAFILATAFSSVAANLNELYEANKQAVVRLNVSGFKPSGEDISEVGTGFVFCSLNGVTYIATAAHALLLDRKLRDRANGDPDRTIDAYFLDDTDAIDLYQGSLFIVDSQFDERSGKDWAIIGLNRKWKSVLRLGQPNELRLGNEAVLLGYTSGGDVVQPTPLTLEVPDVRRGLTLGFGRSVPKGQSGGPVLDNKGRVVGIASANLRDESGSHRAVPVSVLSRTISEHGLSPGCDGPGTSSSGLETIDQPRTQVALFRYRGAIAGQQDQGNIKFEYFRGMIEQKLANIRKQVSQTWDAGGGGREEIAYLSNVGVRYEDSDNFKGNSEVLLWMKKEVGVLNVMRGSIVSDDNSVYNVFTRFYLGDLAPDVSSDEISVNLPIVTSEFANTRDSHTLILVYALAVDAKRSGRPASQVALLLSTAQTLIADLERRLQTLPTDLERIKLAVTNSSREILETGRAVNSSH